MGRVAVVARLRRTLYDGDVLPGIGDAVDSPEHRGLRHTGRRSDLPPPWTVATKRALLTTMSALGLLPVIRDSRWRQRRLLILAYHSISIADEHDWSGEYSISAERFESRLIALRDGGYNVLTLDEGVRRLRDGTLPPRSVVLTFDDGLYDVYARALPLLRKYGFPATVYMTSYFATKGEPLFGLSCSYFLWHGRGLGRPLDSRPITGVEGAWDLASELGRARAHTALLKIATRPGVGVEERALLLERLASAVGLSIDEYLRSRILSLLTPAEVAELMRSDVDVQLHTHRHRMPAEQTLFEREIADNRAFVDPLRGSPARHFCYPSGEYTDAAPSWLPGLGLVSGTTCDPGLATPASNPLLLPRVVDTMFVSSVDFLGWLSGASTLFMPKKAAHYRTRGV